MEKLKYALLFVLGVLSFASCYRDLGNYDYSEINQVTFSGFPEEMQYAYRAGNPCDRRFFRGKRFK